jgi:predicted RNA-binding protein with PIN domain/FtsZ-binding cell division protein ZapB
MRLVAFGAEALGSLPAADVPPALRPVAKFTAAKRARLGGTAIATAIDTDPAFRLKAFDVAARRHPDLVQVLEQSEVPVAADPVDVAAIAYLQRPDGWEKLVDAAAEAVRESADTERREREAEAAIRIREQLDAARASARDTRERLKSEINRLKEENSSLRRKLQQTRQQVAGAQEREQSARSDAAAAVDQAQVAQRAAEAEVRRLRGRLTEAEEAAASARRSGRGERDLGTARLALLLDTLADAASGLRRELALPASSLRPGDTVQGARTPSARPESSGGRSAAEPGYLAELLGLPHVHVVIDGYNVTKTAWPTMPLEAQRARLIQGLVAIAARTGAEVTCVFDGADVTTPPPVSPAQGIRVRFSLAGRTADELIGDLVEAEPEGRSVVVVSSDREIAERVRRPGVRSVEAVALVGLLRS